MIALLITAFIMGGIGSLHCVGMCGPLMLALPVRHLGRVQQFAAILLYNSGRIFTYSIIGLLVGLLGRRIFIAGLQQWVSIMAGIFMLVLAIAYFLGKRFSWPRWKIHIHARLVDAMSLLLQSKKLTGYFFLGAANGLLPCGMVYVAIAAALMTAGYEQSILFMLLFGLGTLPAMLAFGFFGLRIKVSVRSSMKKLVPFFVIGVAVLLILRGMNLGIPFISPLVADLPIGIPCHN